MQVRPHLTISKEKRVCGSWPWSFQRSDTSSVKRVVGKLMGTLRGFLTTIDRDLGYLMLRLGAGLSIAVLHGWSKITGGPAMWQNVGETMSLLGIGFGWTFWGFMAAFSEFACGLLVAVGFLTRLASFFLVSTMSVAAFSHIVGEGSPEMAFIYGLVFLTLLVVGPGNYSVDERLTRG